MTNNTVFKKLLSSIPQSIQPLILKVLDKAPADVRKELELHLDALQKIINEDYSAYIDLLNIIKRSAYPALTSSSKLAIVGSINVGKSTLFNAMLAGMCDKAEVSPVPGTTKKNQNASLGIFSLVDTPGVNHGAKAGEKERNEAFNACEDSDFIIALFDASRGITTEDLQLYSYLTSLEKPFIVALNKIDLISKKDLSKTIKSCADTLGLSEKEITPISADKNQGIEKLLLVAAASEPSLLGELGRMLPALRQKLSWQAIRRSAITCGALSLVPLPIVSFIPLSAIQISMVITIARIYNQPITKDRATELIGTLGFGLIGRYLFQELSKLGGPPGWALSVSISVSTCIALGYAIINWFEKGIAPTTETVTNMCRDIHNSLISSNIFSSKKSPSKKSLTEKLTAPLEHITADLSKSSGEIAPYPKLNSTEINKSDDPSNER